MAWKFPTRKPSIRQLLMTVLANQEKIMTTIRDTDNKVTTLVNAMQALGTDISQLIADEGLSGPLVDSINARLDALNTAVAGSDAQVKAADPGTSSSSSS
jgi:hypothetical protein